MLAFLGLALFAVSLQFDAVQDRYFVGRSEGTIQDILLLEQNFNAAGRDNNWPAVYEACSKRHLWGFGAGATAMITLDATGGRTGHPHNEFLRIYCESGIVGLAVFWSFFLRVGWRGLALFRTRNNEVGATAALAVLALLFFSSTDNATIYTGIFMLPLALILGIAERAYDRRLRPVSVPGAGGW